MMAIRTFAPGDVRVVEEDIPTPGPREAVCKVVNVGICGTDYNIYKGEFEYMVDFPVRPGHEWSGIVEAVGSEIDYLKPGDRVIGQTGIGCDKCDNCIHGDRFKCTNFQSVGTVHAWPGAMCEHELFKAVDLLKLPDSISFEQGALVEPAGNAMMGISQSGITFGSTVLILGTGPIGVAAVAICKAYGAKTIISVGRSDFKLDLCKQFGATHVINTNRDKNVSEIVREVTGGEGVDVTLEISGSKMLFEEAIKSTKPRGSIEMIAFYDSPYNMDLTDFSFRGLTLRSSGGGAWGYFDKVVTLMENGKIDLTPMITHRCSLSEAADEIRNFKVDNDKKVKVMIQVNEP